MQAAAKVGGVDRLYTSKNIVTEFGTVREPTYCPGHAERWRRRPSDGHQQVHGQPQGAFRRERQRQGRCRTIGRGAEHWIRRIVQGSWIIQQDALSYADPLAHCAMCDHSLYSVIAISHCATVLLGCRVYLRQYFIQ